MSDTKTDCTCDRRIVRTRGMTTMNATSPAAPRDFTVAGATVKESAGASDLRPRIKILATKFGASALIVVALGAAVIFGHRYWTLGRLFLESTDDAYVQADSSTIGPKVSGYAAVASIERGFDRWAGDFSWWRSGFPVYP
jgi:hypothetical protein